MDQVPGRNTMPVEKQAPKSAAPPAKAAGAKKHITHLEVSGSGDRTRGRQKAAAGKNPQHQEEASANGPAPACGEALVAKQAPGDASLPMGAPSKTRQANETVASVPSHASIGMPSTTATACQLSTALTDGQSRAPCPSVSASATKRPADDMAPASPDTAVHEELVIPVSETAAKSAASPPLQQNYTPVEGLPPSCPPAPASRAEPHSPGHILPPQAAGNHHDAHPRTGVAPAEAIAADVLLTADSTAAAEHSSAGIASHGGIVGAAPVGGGVISRGGDAPQQQGSAELAEAASGEATTTEADGGSRGGLAPVAMSQVHIAGPAPCVGPELGPTMSSC